MTSRYDSVPMPKDADGREVPLDTKVLYDANGKKVNITSFTFRCDAQNGCWAYWKVFSPDVKGEDGMLYVDELHLARPDSWEKLEKDASKTTCGYFGHSGGLCAGCPAASFHDACILTKATDIVRRAKALAGVTE